MAKLTIILTYRMLLEIDQVNSLIILGLSHSSALHYGKNCRLSEKSAVKRSFRRERFHLLSSGSRTWNFSCRSQEGLLILDDIPHDLDLHATLSYIEIFNQSGSR